MGDELLDLRDFADAALDAISWIARQAVQTLDDDSGLGWPQVESGRLHPPFWCHGATGIGRLLLHAARTCRSVAKGSRWSGPTLTPAAGYGPTRLRLRILAVAGRLVCTARRTQLKTLRAGPGPTRSAPHTPAWRPLTRHPRPDHQGRRAPATQGRGTLLPASRTGHQKIKRPFRRSPFGRYETSRPALTSAKCQS